MKLTCTTFIFMLCFPALLFAQKLNIQGNWKISCGMEINPSDTSILSCTICDLQKSDLPNFQNQFILQIDTIKLILTFKKSVATTISTIPFILFTNEKQMQFTLEGNYYLFSIITSGKDYILKEANEICYLLMEKIN